MRINPKAEHLHEMSYFFFWNKQLEKKKKKKKKKNVNKTFISFLLILLSAY